MYLTTPPSPWMYYAMTIICVMAGAIYYHDFFYVDATVKNMLVGFVWTAMAFVWLYSLYERRRDKRELEKVLKVGPV